MHRSRRAFTLLELLLVLALLAMLLAIAWPAVSRSLSSQRLKRAAESVQTRLARTRTKAITAGEIMSFRFQPDTGNYRVEQATQFNAALASANAGSSSTPSSGAASGAPSSSGSSSSAAVAGAPGQAAAAPPVNDALPEGTVFVSAEVSPDSRSGMASVNDGFTSITDVPWSQSILFFPDGTATTAKIVLRGERGRLITVQLRALTGAAKIGEIEASQELGP